MSLKHFFIHLRWHYQVGILSAAYLLALVYHPRPDWMSYGTQFLNVHLLLYGGATAFNSYWDRDEGPIGGLRHPPPMRNWMRWTALGMMAAGAVWASREDPWFLIIYLFSAFLFWGYSSPLVRWKGWPVGSVFVIAVSTGVNSFLMGCLSAGESSLSMEEWIAAVGVGSMLVSLYPVSQIFQWKEDRVRGDITFAVRYGIGGIKNFFGLTFSFGSLLLVISLSMIYFRLGMLFLFISAVVGGWIFSRLRHLKGEGDEYASVMRLKYGTSVSFILFILLSWIVIYYFR